MMKKTVCLLLSAIFLLSLLVGCKEKETTPTVTETIGAEEETVTGEPYEEATTFSSDVTEFRFLASTVSEEGGRHFSEYEGSISGDKVEKAIYERDTFIEQKYNIAFTFTRTVNWNTELDNASHAEGAEPMYHVATPGISNAVYSLQKGNIGNLDKYGFDFEKSWWNSDAIEQMSVANKHMFALGNLNLLAYDSVGVIFYNKQMAIDCGITDVYSRVNGGTWTYESMIEDVKKVTRDSNGDGIIGVGDTFGLYGGSYSALCFTYAGNFCFVTKDEDGVPTLKETAELQTFFDFFASTVEDHANPDLIAYNLDGEENTFQDNRLLYSVNMLGTSRDLADCGVVYGILPLPKWTETQDGYWTFPHQSASTTICCPIGNTQKEMTRRVIEDMAHYTRDEVLDYYIEDNLYYRRLNGDLDSYNAVLSLLQHLNCDIFFTYKAGITEQLRSCYDNGNANISNTFRKYGNPFRSQIEAILYGALDEE